MNKKKIGFIAIICLFTAIQINAQKRKLSANLESSSLMYEMSHPLHDWDASAKSFKAIIAYNESNNQIEAAAVVAAIKSFDSGNSNRDSHALEVLEALKYPSVTFSASDLTYKSNNEVEIKGKLNFHGIEKEIIVNAKQEISKKQLSISGKMVVNMTDFNVKPPGLMGMNTKEDIRLSFMFSFDL